jgi:hypothetical protein
VHYSGKVVQNSQLHIGVFYRGKLEGVMQFGPSLDKRKLIGLVEGTPWNGFIELNRMAFTDVLPRNSESRAIGIAMRILRKHYPHVQWVVSFADACQCGDGAIYRASGFVLTSVKVNGQNYRLPFADELDEAPLMQAGLRAGDIHVLRQWLESITTHARAEHAHKLTVEDRPPSNKMSLEGAPHAHKMSLEGAPHAHKMSLQGAPHAHKMSLQGDVRPNALLSEVKKIMRKVTGGGTSADKLFRLMGGIPAAGHQLRYLYFLDPTARERLTVPVLPYSEIDRHGARMYKGQSCAASIDSDAPGVQPGEGGATPTAALQKVSTAAVDEGANSL